MIGSPTDSPTSPTSTSYRPGNTSPPINSSITFSTVSAHHGGHDGQPTPEKEKKRRNRISASCSNCRKKRLRCDRGYPCSSCYNRGDECKWEGASVPLTYNRPTQDVAELRAQVDRLSELVDTLLQLQKDNALTGGGSNRTPTGPGGLKRQFSKGSGSSEYSLHTHNLDGSPLRQESEKIDLNSNDLADALSHVAISQLRGSSVHKNVHKNTNLLNQVYAYVDSNPSSPSESSSKPPRPSPLRISTQNSSTSPSKSSSTSSSSSSSTIFPFKESVSMAEVLQLFPKATLATAAITFYLKKVDWFVHPIHLPTAREQWVEIYGDLNNGKDPNPFYLATFFAMCGIGLAQMPQAEAISHGFPIDKDELSSQWLEASAQCLAIGKFLDYPNIEAVRAIVLLVSHGIFISHADMNGKGLGLLSLGVQVALQLEMHREEAVSEGRGTVEAEDRRKLFWLLFSLDTFASSALGRKWSLFNLETIDTKLPQDLEDDEISSKGIAPRMHGRENRMMTSLIIRMKISIVAKKITDQAFGVKPVSYSTVLKFDKELSEIDLPPHYRLAWDGNEIQHPPATDSDGQINAMRRYIIHLSLAQERLRLHRPFLVTGVAKKDTSYSRRSCITSARIILALQRSPSYVHWASAGIVFKSLTAAIALCIEVLQNPNTPESEIYRNEILQAKRLIELYVDQSTIARRGTKILNWLIEKDQQRRAELSLEALTKNDGSPGNNGASNQLNVPGSNAPKQNSSVNLSSPSPASTTSLISNPNPNTSIATQYPGFTTPQPNPVPVDLASLGLDREDWDINTALNNATSAAQMNSNIFSLSEQAFSGIPNEYHFLTQRHSFSEEPESDPLLAEDEPVYNLGSASRQNSMNVVGMNMSFADRRTATNGMGMEISEMETLQNLGIPNEAEWGVMFPGLNEDRLRGLNSFTPIPPRY